MTHPIPKAVLISDIHFNINTLELASSALSQAMRDSERFDVPLIVAGDLHDTKANLRGECVEEIIKLFKGFTGQSFVLVGNHDKINEKSSNHALTFLENYTHIISKPCNDYEGDNLYLIPYHNDVLLLQDYLSTVPVGSTLIMHQGVTDSKSGHYIQDPTAIPKEWAKDFRVFSGHYHTRQDIKCGRPRKGGVGLFTYIGNPYTLNYGESKDPEKGYLVLMSDGTAEFIPTNLRKHVVLELDAKDVGYTRKESHPDDLVWLKVKGTYSQLKKIKKEDCGEWIKGNHNFKLDLIPIDKEEVKGLDLTTMKDEQVLDAIIDLEQDTTEYKSHLKTLWREVLSE